MLKIRSGQIHAFDEEGARRFEDEMVAHAAQFSPRLARVLGPEQLRAAVRQSMGRATFYGFTHRGPIRLFLEMMFLCGSGFDTDPQYQPVGDILREKGDQMTRAERIHQLSLDYGQKVAGPKGANVRRALEGLLEFTRGPIDFPASDFRAAMLANFQRLFPERVNYIGEPPLNQLIDQAGVEARSYRFSTPRQVAMIVILKFAFGHRCTQDPLYPWIERTLNDPKIIEPAARADRLERKAIVWLEHVVATNRQEKKS